MNRSNILRLAHLSAFLHSQYTANNNAAYTALVSANTGNVPEAIRLHIINQLDDINANPATTNELLSVEEAEFNTMLQMLPDECIPDLNKEC